MNNFRPKIALVHDFLNQAGGAEEVLRQIHNIFPNAPVFTLAYNPKRVPKDFKSWKIEPVGWSRRLPRMEKWYKYYMPLYPTMVEQMDLREFDLVISSSYLVAHGVLTRSDAIHLCYCHTPMRQAWELYFDYKHGYTKTGWRLKRDIFKLLYPIVLNYVRMWDKLASERVDSYASNSRTTQVRIKKYYNRDSTIIYPPVEISKFTVAPSGHVGSYFLCLSRLVPYKRIDLAVEAFKRLDFPLWIAGDGPQLKQLKKSARHNIKFFGKITEAQKIELLSRCSALVFPGIEDFGIVPVEAMASGRPVIAYRKGGATETVIDNITGIFFDEQTPESLAESIERFRKMSFDPEKCVERSKQFDSSIFRNNFYQWVKNNIPENWEIQGGA